MDLLTAKLTEISQAIKSKKVSAVEVTDFFLQRISKIDSKINAYVTINEGAKQQAQKIDERIRAGEDVGLLAGVPFGIKDMFCTKGIKTTASSKILSNFIPPYDATAVAKLKSAGAVILGKLNQDEFAMGSSNETSFQGVCKNPWNTDYVPGGSSGGSAAAQAARLAAATLGTDTGGSIRQPASFCGVVGVKPTYGRISRYGIISYASSLDQAGPITSSVEDAATCLEIMCGQDTYDQTTSNRAVPHFTKALDKKVSGLRVGIVKEYTGGKLSSEVDQAFQKTIEILKAEGASIVEVSVPLTEMAIPIYYLVATSEASSNLARYDGVKYGHRAKFDSLANVSLQDFYGQTRAEGFGEEVKRRIMLGTYCLSSGYYEAYYNKACQVRRLLQQQYLKCFEQCDVILSPVATSAAFRIGEKVADPLAMYLNDIFTVSANLAGLPGMSVPVLQNSVGLPVGVQLMAAPFAEQTMLNVGYCLQENLSMKAKVANV